MRPYHLVKTKDDRYPKKKPEPRRNEVKRMRVRKKGLLASYDSDDESHTTGSRSMIRKKNFLACVT